MENLFKELAWKAYQNGLDFECNPRIGKSELLEVRTFDKDHKVTYISEGATAGWQTQNESALAALERMHQEVDEYINLEVKSHEG